MLSMQDLRHIASNPDGCDVTDIEYLAHWIGQGCHPAPQAAHLFGIDSDSRNRVNDLKEIRKYCVASSKARRLRADGRIERAMTYEREADRHYDRISVERRW